MIPKSDPNLGAVWRSPRYNIQASTLKLAPTVTMHIVDKEEVVLFPEAKTVLRATWVSTKLFSTEIVLPHIQKVQFSTENWSKRPR